MNDQIRHRGPIRAGLALLALPQLAIGVWALASPSGWYEDFPGAGRSWLPLYGSFDEHLATDVGSTFLALGVLLVIAAVAMDRRLVRVAAIVYLVYQLPHAVFHFGGDDVLSDGDRIANAVALAAALALALAIALATRLPRPTASAPADLEKGSDSGPAPSTTSVGGGDDRRGVGRLGQPRGGLVARASRAYARRMYGKELAPTDAYLHHKRLMLGYGAFETAVLVSHRVDEKLKALAELRAAQVVGCEWCMDFGSMLGREHGVDERQLRELALYRDSDAFDERERLVIEYATAISRTPSEVDDELFARMRERFDDPQLVELTNAIAIENHRARFNHALGLGAQGFSEGAACVVGELAARG